MARLLRGQTSATIVALAMIPGLLMALPTRSAEYGASSSFLYDQPVLTVDPGLHTAELTDAAVDALGRFAVTGSHDKTVRIWSLEDGRLLQTVRLPAGPGQTGKVDAVAMSPDGQTIAAGGATRDSDDQPIYLFDRATGRMKGRIPGLSTRTHHLAFSPDGTYLAAGLHEADVAGGG